MRKLIWSELRKILWHPWVPLLLVGALAAANYQLVQTYFFAPEYNEYGKSFYTAYGGTLTRENYEKIKELQHVQREGMAVSYESMWSGKALNDIEYLVSFASDRQELLDMAQDNVGVYQEAGMVYEQRLNEYICQQYGEKPGVQLVAIYEWEHYFDRNSFLQIPLLVIVLLLAAVFTNEKESGCYPVLAASVSGRKGIFKAKLIAALLVSLGIMLLFVTIHMLISMRTSPLTNWDAPIQSIYMFERCPYMITIGQGVLIRGALLCVMGMVHGLLVCLFSSLFSRNISGMIAGGFWYLLSYFWYPLITYNGMLFGISVENKSVADLLGVLRKLYYPMLSEPEYYLTRVDTIDFFGYPVPSLWMCLGITLLAAAGCSMLAYHCYMKNDLSCGRECKGGKPA